MKLRTVGVLGGGVSGMAISRHLAGKGLEVSLLEQSPRSFGGWVSSIHVGEEKVLFEQGPHSLRPRAKGNGLRVVELLIDLGLEPQGKREKLFIKNNVFPSPKH